MMRISRRPLYATPTGDEAQFAPNECVAGRYRVVARIGQGGMGQVYEAVHEHLGRRVALKVLRSIHQDPVVIERFMDEPKAASAVHHPNIVQVLDAGFLGDGRPYICMPFIDGQSLADAIENEENGRLDALRVVRIAKSIASALAAVHRRGIVHRDLKPDNVMLTPAPEGERVVLVDFGIAYSSRRHERRLTRDGVFLGTPRYMAPEQSRGAAISPAFDIYALGALMHTMLSGSAPFEGLNPLEVLVEKLRKTLPALPRQADTPPELLDLVDACVKRSPKDRPSSAQAIVRVLERIERQLVPTPIYAPESPEIPQAARGRAWVAGSVVAMGLGGLAAATLNERDDAEPCGGTVARATSVVHGPNTPTIAKLSVLRSSAKSEAVRAEAKMQALEAQARPSRSADKTVAARTQAMSDRARPSRVADKTGIRAKAVVKQPPAKPVVKVAEPAPPTKPPEIKPPKVEPPKLPPPPTSEASTSSHQAVPMRGADKQRLGSECAGTSERADEARRAHRWAEVLHEVERGKCWSDEQKRERLRVLALKELKRFKACAARGRGASDPTVRRWVELCEQRAKGSR